MSVHALSAFSAISKGMSLEAIRERLGRPRRETGQGTKSLEYAVADGSRLEILYATPQLIKIIHYRTDGTRVAWVPS